MEVNFSFVDIVFEDDKSVPRFQDMEKVHSLIDLRGSWLFVCVSQREREG